MNRPSPKRRLSQLTVLAAVAIALGLVMLAYDIYQLFQPQPALGGPPFLCTIICGWLAYMLLAKARKLARQNEKPDQLDPPPDKG